MAMTQLPSKRPRGRPRKFNAQLGREICRRVSNGQSLRQVGMADDMPSSELIRQWLSRVTAGEVDEELKAFYENYCGAVEDRAEGFADRVLELVDNCPATDMAHVHRVKIQCDGLRWLAAVTAPKKYGTRPEIIESVGTNLHIGVQIVLPDNRRDDVVSETRPAMLTDRRSK